MCVAGSLKRNSLLLKLLFYRTESINECVLWQLARVKMESNLKTSGRFFQVFALLSEIKLVKTDLVSFFFQNSFDFVSLVV